MAECPVCFTTVLPDRWGRRGEWYYYDCRCCGEFAVTHEVLTDISGELRRDPRKSRAVSYEIRKITRQGTPKFTTYALRPILEVAKLPTVAEAADNLVLSLGEATEVHGQFVPWDVYFVQATMGASGPEQVPLVLNELINQGLLNIKASDDGPLLDRFAASRLNEFLAMLTFKGWRRWEELQATVVNSKRAFMAMQFGDTDLDTMFTQHFVPAVATTGFSLRRIIDQQPAGLIDDRLRVELRASRFVIADLTHGNKGAYWEAGFAEGLGRPVIYTCRADVFNDHHTKPHFDTNHYLTVVWDSGDPASSAQRLKDTIRVTLPGEAKLED